MGKAYPQSYFFELGKEFGGAVALDITDEDKGRYAASQEGVIIQENIPFDRVAEAARRYDEGDFKRVVPAFLRLNAGA